MDNFQKDKYAFSGRSYLKAVGEENIEGRNVQIVSLIDELTNYKVLLRDLPDYEIDYKTRNELLNIAFFVIHNLELYQKFIDDKELPINLLAIKVNKSKKYLKDWYDYIVAYIIIYSNPEYSFIQDYVQVTEMKKTNKNKKQVSIVKYQDNNSRGVVLNKNKINGIMLTLSGEFKRVKVKQAIERGHEIEGIKGKGFKDHKFKISILILLIIMCGIVISWQYTKPTTVLVIDATTKIKVKVNTFNRVIDIESNQAIGNKIIDKIDVVDKNLDKALSIVIESLHKEEIISDKGVVITISGEPIKYDAISKTEDYIFVNNLEVRFNNNGIEHKLD